MAHAEGTTTAGPGVITGRTIADQEAEFVASFVQASLRKRQAEGLHEVWDEVQNNWFVVPVGSGRNSFFPPLGSIAGSFGNYARLDTHPTRVRNRSVLKDPETHQATSTLVSQGMQLLFPDAAEFIAAQPIGEDDYHKARLMSRLLMGVFSQRGVYGTFARALTDAFLFGTAIFQVTWQSLSRMQLTETPVMDEQGRVLGSAWAPGSVTYMNNVRFGLIDHYDFYPDADGTRIHEDMMGAAKRFRLTEQDALDLAEPGPNGEPPVYDTAATIRALQIGRVMDSGGRTRFEGTALTGGDFRAIPFKRVVGFEYWGRVPIRYPNGIANRVITVINGVVVRSHIIPFIDGAVPFVAFVVNPISGRFWGLSPAAVVRYLQDSADNLLMAINDSVNLAVRPMLLVGRGFGGDIERVRRRRFNDVLYVDDPTKLGTVPFEANALVLAAQERMTRKMNIREAMGATNPLQAIPSSDRQTATETAELVRLAGQRVDMMIRVIERDAMPEIGKMVHSRIRQHADENLIAFWNGERVVVPFEMINADADIRFIGSRAGATKATQSAAYDRILNRIAQNPDVLIYGRELLVREARDILGMADAEAVINSMAQAAIQIKMQNMAMEAATQGGAAAAQTQGEQQQTPPGEGAATRAENRGREAS